MTRTAMDSLPDDRVAQLATIRQRCAEEWGDARLFWFTDHGPAHSEQVLLLIEEFLDATPYVGWSPSEIFVLAAAAWLHDVGMQQLGLADKHAGEYTAGDWDSLRSRHAQNSFELIRDDCQHSLGVQPSPPKRGRARRASPAKHFLNLGIKEPAVGRAIALTCRGHAMKHFAEVCKSYAQSPVEPFPGQVFRGDLVAAVLLIADEMHLHNSRAHVDHLEDYSPETRLHHLKHHYVDGSHFVSTAGGIESRVWMSFPPGCAWADDYKRLVSIKLESQLRLLDATFSLHGVRVVTAPVVSVSDDDFKLDGLPPADIAYGRQALMRMLVANEKDVVGALEEVASTGGPIEVSMDARMPLGIGSSMVQGQIVSWLQVMCEAVAGEAILFDFTAADGAGTDLSDLAAAFISMPSEEVTCRTPSEATELLTDAMANGASLRPAIIAGLDAADENTRQWIERDLVGLSASGGFPLVLLSDIPSKSWIARRAQVVPVTLGDWHSFARSWGIDPAANRDLAAALESVAHDYEAAYLVLRAHNRHLGEVTAT